MDSTRLPLDRDQSMSRDRSLLTFIIAYGMASLVHFVHNAVYIDAYPNLPAWITPVVVYVSWLAIAGTGAFGYWLYRRGSRAFGLTVIGVYALSGFGGLDHYTVAPVSSHSMAMNATILGEAIAASVLLVVIVRTGISFRSR
jgi:hypothetical protein